MNELTPSERLMRSSIAAHTSWAHTEDRTARIEPARRALLDRFEREVDPDNKLPAARVTKRDLRGGGRARLGRLPIFGP